MLFMGEEFAASTPWQFFTSHPEPELGKATAEGRIKEFERMGWDPAVVPDPQDPETFHRSKLNWDEASGGDHARLLDLYRSLTALRREHAEVAGLGFEDTEVAFDDDERWLRFRRGTVEVLMNFSDAKIRLDDVRGAVLLATDEGSGLEGEALALAPWSAAILKS
jgi:maltooligosyltrehalose trehalohydrolase